MSICTTIFKDFFLSVWFYSPPSLPLPNPLNPLKSSEPKMPLLMCISQDWSRGDIVSLLPDPEILKFGFSADFSSFWSGDSLVNKWTTHCLKPMGFLLRRPRNLLSPQALIRTVPALYCYSFYTICLNPSSNIFFAALMSLSCVVPQTGHTHSLTDRFFVSVFWYPQAEHSWLLA